MEDDDSLVHYEGMVGDDEDDEVERSSHCEGQRVKTGSKLLCVYISGPCKQQQAQK